jgi:hypothetical protein
MKKSFFGIITLLLFCQSAAVAGPAIWSVNSRADVLKGDARGVSIDSAGTITIAPKLTEIFRTDQPYIWASAVDTAGNTYLGTGSDGKIFKVDATGKGLLLADLNELNVSALAIARNGDLFAATSPDGKVYRVDPTGKSEVYFDPKEKYIWSLAALPDGGLAVGTGDTGKLYRVRSANATPETSLLFDTSETHVIALAVDRQGNIYAGTDSNGLVLRFGPDGKPFGVLDSPLREIQDIEIGPDGSIYALAIGDTAAPSAAKDTTTPEKPESRTVTVERTTVEPTQKSRYDLTGAKSAVYRILPDGGSDILWTSNTINAFSIYPHQTGSGVLIGTSDRGRVYSVTNEGRDTLVFQSDAGQISTIRSSGASLIATSSNQGNLYRIGPDPAAEGIYESAVLDAKATATWGRIWWQGTGNVQIQTRSGNTEKADETWSVWSSAYSVPTGGQITSPKARYMQWRAVLKPGTLAASLSEVNVGYLGRNIAPEVLQIQVLPTNVGLVPNPPAQVDPNIELSGLDPTTFGLPNTAVAPRRVYQRNATSLAWLAEDRNGDKLVYDVFYKQIADSAFKPLKENISENFYTIDGLSLADGRYVFKIVARDSGSNPAGTALSGERTSEPVDIDNSPPTVTSISAPAFSGDRLRVGFEAADAASYITRAEFSVNGGDWQPVYAEDGISDGPRERYTFEIPASASGEYSITLRAFDANGNSGNARVVARR